MNRQSTPSAKTLRNRRKRQRRRLRKQEAQQGPVSRTGRTVRRARGRDRGSYNPYLECLLNPERPGCKVPDVESCPSGTFQVTHDYTLTTDASGNAAYLCTGNLTNDYGTFAASAAGNWGNFAQAATAGVAAAYNIYDRYRVVSQSISADFIGSSNADQGIVIGGQLLKSQAWPTAVANVSALTYSDTVPLRQGIRVCYRPLDNNDFEYSPRGTAGFQANGTPNPYSNSQHILYVAVIGAAAATAVLRIRRTVNFEGIPLADTLNVVNVSTSPVNLEWIQGAMQDLAGLPFATAKVALGSIGAAGLIQQAAAYATQGAALAAPVLLRSSRNSWRQIEGV